MSVSEKEYPQFKVSPENVQMHGTLSAESFRKAPAIHHRPGKLLKAEQNERGVDCVFAVQARSSVLSYTHETALDLYREEKPELESLRVRVEMWADDIYRVTLTDGSPFVDHFAKLPENYRMLVGKPKAVHFDLAETETELMLTTSKIALHIQKSNGCISSFYPDGTPCCAECRSSFQAADIYDLAIARVMGDSACFEALTLGHDEMIYGLGERFDSLTRNGRTVDFHNKDAVGTTSRRTYINIPFFMSTKGYGLFLNSAAETDWQIATTDAGALQFSVFEPQMDYFVLCAKKPKDILKLYCDLTGYSKLPPIWSFGLWMSRNSYTSWDVAEEIARETRAHDIPCDVLHLDTAWFSSDWNCDLRFSTKRFPDPEGHMKKLKENGFTISLWQYNFIPPRPDNLNYAEAVEKGYLAKGENGNRYQLPVKGGWSDDAIIDFSNPEARAWYAEQIRALMRMGAGAIKTDFGEGIPEAAKYACMEGKYFHNLYTLVYNGTVFDACKDVTGENIVWARSGTAGSQRFPIHWGGDSQCTFEALASTLRGALTAGMSGIPFFSHDIGGFIGLPDDELYVRWAQVGLFSSHSRCHGAGDTTYREPWRFSDQACEIFRFYDKLRYSLMPYIYAEAEDCVNTGLPMMRALILEYPEDRNVRCIDDEYLFGRSLLIAPVLKKLSESRTRSIYLPAGVWYDYFTKEKYVSRGEWIEKEVRLETLPIYVKQGAKLEYCAEGTSLVNGYGEIVKTEVWED